MPASSTQRLTPSGIELDRHAERLEHVGRAALRRRGPGAVLAHRHPGAGDDDRRHRRHVDRVAAVAAGADDVDRPGRAGPPSSGTTSAAPSTASSRPDSSSGVSPFARRATTKPISWAGVASPARIVVIAARAWTAVRSRCSTSSVSSAGQPPCVSSDASARLAVSGSRHGRTLGTARPGVLRRASSGGAAPLADQPPPLALGGATPDALLLPCCRAYSRQATRTPHSAQTALASSASSSSSG